MNYFNEQLKKYTTVIKRKSITLTTFFLLFSVLGFTQAPKKMSYQSVIRDGNGLLVGNQTVSIRIKILQGATNGDSLYVETHSVTTNVNGLATLEIGGGSVEMGSFANINWGNGSYFLKTETDPNGGSNYTITGVNQLLSVPYSLYAKKAETVEMYADGNYVLDYLWEGNLNGNNPANIASTTASWKGNRVIMLNGYVHFDFEFNQGEFTTGTANVDLYLKYNGQTIMPLNFKEIGIGENANITLPLSALILNSTAGNSMQFSVEGVENASYTQMMSDPGGTTGPYPIDVKVTVVFSWVEL